MGMATMGAADARDVGILVQRPRYTAPAVDVGLGLGVRAANRRAEGSDTSPAAVADDAPLVEALARGETSALDVLYQRHSRGVYSLALHLLGDPGAAEDVVQETFLKLWRRPGAYQPGRGRLLPWLLGVAHHHAVDLLRRRQLEQRHRASNLSTDEGQGELADSLHLASDEPDPATQVSLIEQQHAVVSALNTLPPAQRIPLELAYYQGLTQVEIAQALGEPLGTIKTRMRLALLRLRSAPALEHAREERR